VSGRNRIQLCGRLVVDLDGSRLEAGLPGRQGCALLAVLTLERPRVLTRDALIDALWGERPPAAADAALSALLSKLRRVLGPERLRGRGELSLDLPPGVSVDVEEALEALERAEAALARGDAYAAYGPGFAARYILERGLLPGNDAPGLEDWRRRLGEDFLRALECTAEASLRVGGSELPSAEATARALIAAAPFRQCGHRLLVETLAARGEVPEALRAYERLRRTLRDELGVAPGPELRELHARLLGREGAAPATG
jgi:DNA-binding SARP family transcriptional activator